MKIIFFILSIGILLQNDGLAIDVTFRVNMTIEIEEGRFNPSSDYIDVAGTFNDWGGRVNRLTDEGASIYSATISGFTAGQAIEFKFRYNGSWDGREEFPGVDNNRRYTVQADDNLVDVWYNDVSRDGEAITAAFSMSGSLIQSNSVIYVSNDSRGNYTTAKWLLNGSTHQIISTDDGAYIRINENATQIIELELTDESGQLYKSSQTLEIQPRSYDQLEEWNDRVYYEIFVRSFQDSDGDGIGDFQGLIDRLDYLNDGDPETTDDLGITGIWLMPINPSASYHGYDVTDFRAIHPELGTMDDFREFLEEAHDRGIDVIIDYVMNHSSRQHPWFIEAKNPSSDRRDWYVWSSSDPGYNGPWGQQVWHRESGNYFYGVFWDGMPDLNYVNPAVQEEMFDIADYWLNDIGIDGFRLDAVKYITEQGTNQEDTPPTLSFWKEYQSTMKTLNTSAYSIGEAWTSTDKVLPYVNDGGLDMCFDFDLSYAIINSVNRTDNQEILNQILNSYASYPHNQWGTFISNHDQNRAILSLSNNPEKLKTASALQLTLPGVPYIYYGNEIGMTGLKPDENIRRPMQWSSQPQGGFTSGTPWNTLNNNFRTVNVNGQSPDPSSLLSHYRALIHLRQSEPALQRGELYPVISSEQEVVSYIRSYNGEQLLVSINLSDQAVSVELDAELTDMATGRLTFDRILGEQATITVNNRQGTIDLGPREVLIAKLDQSTSTISVAHHELAIYPNPAIDQLIISNLSVIGQDYSIVDLIGRTVQTGVLCSHQLSIERLSAGQYTLQVQSKSGLWLASFMKQ